jgi:RsiW-degrading membrane proteinase PrsW (M82 family)
MLVKFKFLRVFLLVVLMHALWDTPISGMFPFGQIFLMLVSWVAVFLLIRAGLKEIANKKSMSKMDYPIMENS